MMYIQIVPPPAPPPPPPGLPIDNGIILLIIIGIIYGLLTLDNYRVNKEKIQFNKD